MRPRSSSLRQWHVYCWYAGDAALLVFPSLLSGPDAPHHGRYEQEGQLRSDTVWIFLGDSIQRNVWFDSGYFFRQSTRRSRRLRSTRKLGAFLEVTSRFVPGSSFCLVRQRIHIASVYEGLFLFTYTAQCLSSVVHAVRLSTEW